MGKFPYGLIIFILTLLGVGFSGCSSFSENSSEQNYPSSDEKRLMLNFSDDNIHLLGIDETSAEYCEEFYSRHNYKPVWVKDSLLEGKDLDFLNFLNSDISLNLPVNHLRTRPFTSADNPYQKELISLLRLAEYMNIQEQGFINFQDTSIRAHSFAEVNSLQSFIQSIGNSKSWKDRTISYNQKSHLIKPLHYALNEFTGKYPLNYRSVQLDINKDTIGDPGNGLAKALKKHGFLSDTIISVDSLKSVFSKFQYANGLSPDGVLGKNSLEALQQTNLQRYYKGILALERLKHFPDSLRTDKFIDVNIPSFLLHFYNADTLVSRHRVIVGTNENQTPQFYDTLTHIVTHPYWHVPYSIASTEVLYGARNDSAFFEKRNYKLLDSGKVISPDSVDWNKIKPHAFPFRVRQEGGRSNSLGLIKILFPNENAIYIHDTPAKYLFERDIRNFSHGCIRTEDPIKLARNILRLEDHYFTNALDTLVLKEKETFLTINDTILVSIDYRTAAVDDSTGQVRFYKDIYSREEKFLKLFDKPLP